MFHYPQQQLKYFLYARKSSESEDRQMASIESQIDELKRLAEQEGITVVKVFSESRSAKEPGRPVFTEMIERIHKGEANGIICWKLNRLARNPIDGGQISWLLQQGVIQHIQTYGKSYYPTDNVIVMSVELGMANQFLRDLSTDTKRGLKSKAERGWNPSCAPTGYTHNPLKKKGEKEIIPDPERFQDVRKLFDLMLTGEHSVPEVWKKARKEIGLTSRTGKKIARNTMYQIFTNPFYYGEFEYPKGSGNWYQGEHEPMITKEEFEKIQFMIGRKVSPKPKTYTFAFRGPLYCGECGCMITAEHKKKPLKNGKTLYYVYYHCTKKKGTCSQKSIEEKELEKQILEILGQIEIFPEFHEWAMDKLKRWSKEQKKDVEEGINRHKKDLQRVLDTIDGLITMRANKELSEEEFKSKKDVLSKEQEKLKFLINEVHSQTGDWLETADQFFAFTERVRERFENGTLEERKGILNALGSNLYLKDKKVSISLTGPLQAMKTASAELKQIHKGFEPVNTGEIQAYLKNLYEENPVLLREQDSNL